jgi:ANTAR domain
MDNGFDAAIDALSALKADDSSVAEPLLGVMPVSGVSVSTIGSLLGTETVSATDDLIAHVDELQFDLSEGPCWDALEIRGPILEPDLRGNPQHFWPAFTKAIRDEEVAAIFAFPLLVGPLKIGAIDMYRTEPGELSAEHREQTVTLAGIISRHVLRRAMLVSGSDANEEKETPFSRRLVHQATGFVIAQLGVSPEDALLLIQGQAFADGRSVHDVAGDIVSRRLRFSVEGNRIEDQR